MITWPTYFLFRLSSILLGWWVLGLLASLHSVGGLRCYVCGGHSGTPCRGGVGDTTTAQDIEIPAQDPVQECTDLINNRGCVKQFVNGGTPYCPLYYMKLTI